VKAILKADVLRERKRLKAVHRRKGKIKNHNYISKTLEKPSPILAGMTEAVKETINKLYSNGRFRTI